MTARKQFRNTNELIEYYGSPDTPQSEVDDILFRLGAAPNKPMLCDLIAKAILYKRTGIMLPTLYEIMHGEDEEE